MLFKIGSIRPVLGMSGNDITFARKKTRGKLSWPQVLEVITWHLTQIRHFFEKYVHFFYSCYINCKVKEKNRIAYIFLQKSRILTFSRPVWRDYMYRLSARNWYAFLSCSWMSAGIQIFECQESGSSAAFMGLSFSKSGWYHSYGVTGLPPYSGLSIALVNPLS